MRGLPQTTWCRTGQNFSERETLGASRVQGCSRHQNRDVGGITATACLNGTCLQLSKSDMCMSLHQHWAPVPSWEWQRH